MIIAATLVASVAANALTIALKDLRGLDPSSSSPIFLSFNTASGGSSTLQIASPTSLVISSGSLMGQSGATGPFRLWLVIFSDGSLGAICCSAANRLFKLDEAAVHSAVAEGGAGAADSAFVIYATGTITNLAMRIIGFLTWNTGLAAAGTWDALPDVVQIYDSAIAKPGEIVQSTTTAGAGTGSVSVTTPYDDTPPQVTTESTVLFTSSIVPSSPANWLEHDIDMQLSAAVAPTTAIVSLFRDSNVSAELTFAEHFPTSDVFHKLTGYGISRVTDLVGAYSLGLGSSDGSTIRYNQVAAGRKFAGTMFSAYRITERMG